MIIGIPREIKEHEYRVGITPAGVSILTGKGHRLFIEESAGEGSGFTDDDYRNEGALIADKTRLFRESELIVKVKEPLASEYGFFQEGQSLFTFLHLAAVPELTAFLLKKGVTAFGYETLEEDGSLPLLMPMSEIAGKMAPVVAAYFLQKVFSGAGVLFTGVEGVPSARVLILGAGAAGMSSLAVAHGMRAGVTVINRGADKLRKIDRLYRGEVRTLAATRENIEAEAVKADAVICAVLIPGARTPKLISRGLIGRMKRGTVLVDISVDQGGCAETTRPTTHNDPVYSVDGVIHYAVANMPGAYPRTSTLALTGRTLKYIEEIADSGTDNAISKNASIRSALNTYRGRIMHRALSEL